MLRKAMERRHEEEGFTLIELMVVVLIIGILIAIALPTFLGARARAQDRAAQSNLRNAMAAAKTFFTDNDSYTGFTQVTANSVEPSINWQPAGAPVAGSDQVRIDTANAAVVVMADISGSGKFFCIGDNSSGVNPATAGTWYGSPAAAPGAGVLVPSAACGAARKW